MIERGTVMSKRYEKLKKANIITLVAVILAAFPSWINPGPEAAGLSFMNQIGGIILPVLLIYIGVMCNGGIIKKAVICVAGYLMFVACIYYVIANAGISLNIGEISFLDAMKWATPWLWVFLAVSAISLLVTAAGVLRENGTVKK